MNYFNKHGNNSLFGKQFKNKHFGFILIERRHRQNDLVKSHLVSINEDINYNF